MTEVTKKQIVSGRIGRSFFGTSRLPASYETYREMRKDPTIALARALATASVVSAEWSVEAKDDAPEGAVEFVMDQFGAIREPLVERAMLGGIDFGHQPWEKIFTYRPDGLIGVKFKPLLQDITEILTTEDTGAFVGFRQAKIDVPISKCLLIPFRVEGTNWYGEPLLENARNAYNWWVEANKGAVRYDNKIAGSHFVVKYPNGTCIDATGQEIECAVQADRLLQFLEASGSIIIPASVAEEITGLNDQKAGWEVSILEDAGGRQPTFIERLRYLDTIKCRAMLLPERAVLEGQFGTLAEAAAHGDLALTNAELTHRHITRHVNWYAVDQVLALNWGERARGSVWLEPAPIVDEKRAFLREIYRAVLANPSGFLQEFGLIDLDSLKDALGVPKAKEDTSQPVLPTPVDPNNPQAAALRRIYANLGA